MAQFDWVQYICIRKERKKTPGEKRAINSYKTYRRGVGGSQLLMEGLHLSAHGEALSKRLALWGLQPLQTTNWWVPVSIKKLKLLNLLKRANIPLRQVCETITGPPLPAFLRFMANNFAYWMGFTLYINILVCHCFNNLNKFQVFLKFFSFAC